MRTIFHVDMDAFFVSVEELFDPSLKGKPVVVGGAHDERGVVSAASYAARKFGVHSAMPLRTAYKLCPQAIFVPGNTSRYRTYSRKVRTVLEGFSPLLEMASIDEAYLDMTGTERLHGPPLRAAHTLYGRMLADTGLNCSVGIGTSRLIAKISSGQAKPNGVLQVLPGREAPFLAPLTIGTVPGVGKATEARLHARGIRLVGDVARLDPAELQSALGALGLALAGKARGEDAGGWFAHAVGSIDGAKSISHEHTFTADTAEIAQLEGTLARLAEMVGRRLREHGLYARTVQVKLRNAAFQTVTRAKTLREPANLDQELREAACALFRENWKPGVRMRLLGVAASGLESEPPEQRSLLTESQKVRLREATAAADRMRDRFGDQMVGFAGSMQAGFREKTHESLPSVAKTSVKNE